MIAGTLLTRINESRFSKILGTATAAILLATTLVTVPSLNNPEPAFADTPVAGDSPPSWVILERVYGANNDATITATLDVAIEDSGSTVSLYEVGNSTAVSTTTSGTVVNFPVVRPATSFKQYYVMVNSLTSNKVTVDSATATWTIGIQSSAAVFGTNDITPKINWTMNQRINVQSYYGVYFVDDTTGAIFYKATNLNALTGQQTIPRFYNGVPHEYSAYIAKWNSAATSVAALTEIQAVSNSVRISRAAWTIGFSIDRDEFSTNDPTPRFTWTTNQTVAGSSGAYSVYVVDETLGTIIKNNWNITTLSYTYDIPRIYGSEGHTYKAYIASRNDQATLKTQITGIQAESQTAFTHPSAWNLSLKISASVFSANDPTPQFTWTTNQTISGSNGTYSVYVVDETLGTIVKNNWNITTLSYTYNIPRFYDGGSHFYKAYLAKRNDQATLKSQIVDIQATSGTVSVERSSWDIGLSVSDTSFSTNEITPKFTWVTNQTISGSNGSYSVYVVNAETG
jgi:hypothetical protein